MSRIKTPVTKFLSLDKVSITKNGPSKVGISIILNFFFAT